MGPMSEARAKLYINTGVVTGKSDMYNILRPLLKQTVSYTYHRGARIESSGTGWVERIVVDHPDVASYFTPLAICLNLDSFDYLQFDTTSDQLLVYTLVIGSERVVLEFAASGAPRLGLEPESASEEAGGGRPLPRNAEELARDLRFIQMELLMSADMSSSIWMKRRSRASSSAFRGSGRPRPLAAPSTSSSAPRRGCPAAANSRTTRSAPIVSV